MKSADNKELDALLAEASKLVQPIDFAGLERQGIIAKAGAWYRVHNWEALPEHAKAKIYEVAKDAKGVKVKFTRASKPRKS